MTELLLGCGSRRDKLMHNGKPEWENLVTLDNVVSHKPDVVFDLRQAGSMVSVTYLISSNSSKTPFLPMHFEAGLSSSSEGYRRGLAYSGQLPFQANSIDEIHAYEVLEHIGEQGNAKQLLDQFSEFWRILKPGGLFFATVPDFRSFWAWGDPSHSRVINEGTLIFLHQPTYVAQVGKTPMSDFRHLYKADFDPVYKSIEDEQFRFMLRAIKPSRYVAP